MIIYQILTVLWVAFILYWFVSAFKAKKTVSRNWASYGVRLIVVLLIIILFNTNTSGTLQRFITLDTSLSVKIIGLVLVALGIACAIWARVHIGKNWGMPMSLKEKPELIMTGPYTYVRHPIYSGILLAMIGSALVGAVGWVVPVIVFFIYFMYSARVEEKILTKEFPHDYPSYMKKTKMLIPFLL
jgi:protein-S-isoprenylcysteine O-methyltransferase Ste14